MCEKTDKGPSHATTQFKIGVREASLDFCKPFLEVLQRCSGYTKSMSWHVNDKHADYFLLSIDLFGDLSCSLFFELISDTTLRIHS